MPPQVGVGVAAFIFDFTDDTVLLVKRDGSHGEGTWAPPGGWVEKGESLLEAAEREVLEEVGLRVEAIQEFGYTEDHFSEDVHDICFTVVCKWQGDIARIMEPEKIVELKWAKVNDLLYLDPPYPQPLFLPLQMRIDSGDFKTMYDIFKENPGD